MFKYLFIFALGFFISISGFAQSNLTLTDASRITEPITLDGIVVEPVWSSLSPLPLTMHWPNYNGEMTEKTTFYLAYDDEYLYVAAICYDKSPDKIQTPSFERDNWTETMDQIALVVDSYNDNETAVMFIVTASGSRVDASVKNDALDGGSVSESWNSYWDGDASFFDGGWMAEMRIPFSSLRFQTAEGSSEMGIGLYRYIPRKREMQLFPDIPADWGYWSFVKPSRLAKTRFNGVENERPWYISPYALGGLGHHHEYDSTNIADKINDNDFQIGLDVQHAFTDNLNADFTINTDFAQVEADDQTINLSRFSLFFPEKRRFFLERSSTFDFQADGNNNLFYSRRIGINDGQLVPMLGGARLVGRVNSWDLGVINMQSRKVSDIASENFGVLRLRRNVFNSRSYLGGMATSRINTDGYTNYAYGLDGLINVFGEEYLQFNLAQSTDSNDPDNLSAIDRSRIYVLWQNRQEKGFGYSFSYSNVGQEYKPGIGFERRFNFSEFQTELNYVLFVPERSRLRTIEFELTGETSLSNSTGNMETRSIGGELTLNGDRGAVLSLSSSFLTDRVPDDFDLSDDIMIVAGEYHNSEYNISYDTPTVGLIKSSFSTGFGSFYDGNMLTASVTPTIVLSRFLQLSGFYQYSNIDFNTLGETFESHLARLKMSISFNVRWSVSTFAQLNTLNELSTMNFRLRYNRSDGNDLYLVYNEIINNNPDAYSPALPLSESRALMVKYIHTFKY